MVHSPYIIPLNHFMVFYSIWVQFNGLNIGSIGPLPSTSPYKHTMIMSGKAKLRFNVEHDTVPLDISPCLSVTAPIQMQLPLLWL